AIHIPAGFVGVVTNLVGAPPKQRNQYLSEEKERGIQKTTLKPGTYYVNPHAVRIDNVDVQTKRLELPTEKSDEDRGIVAFFSSDGFEIDVHLTLTWQVDERRAPEVLARTPTTGEGSQRE